MLDPDDPEVRAATFGRIVEDFLAGPIGSYLVNRAREEEAEAVQALKTTFPEDRDAIRRFQNQALVADKICEWLADVVMQGQMSLQKLKEDQDGD